MRNDGPMESHPSPNLTEAGKGMTESVGEVCADNPPLKIKKVSNILPNNPVFQFSMVVLRQSQVYAKNVKTYHGGAEESGDRMQNLGDYDDFPTPSAWAFRLEYGGSTLDDAAFP